MISKGSVGNSTSVSPLAAAEDVPDQALGDLEAQVEEEHEATTGEEGSSSSTSRGCGSRR